LLDVSIKAKECKLFYIELNLILSDEIILFLFSFLQEGYIIYVVEWEREGVLVVYLYMVAQVFQT